MVACENKQIEVGKLLIMQFPICIGEQNKSGMDAVRSSEGAHVIVSLTRL